MYLRVFLRKSPAEVPLNRMTMAVLKCFICIFCVMETYIMHFLEAARFLNATVLAGRKVNILFAPGLAAILPPPLQLFGP